MTTSRRIVILHLVLAISVSASALSEPRKINVALVGDSLAFGAGDESGKGLGGRLEPELRSRGIHSIVTTNLGATGATTRDLEKSLRQRATQSAIARANAVVVSIGAN